MSLFSKRKRLIAILLTALLFVIISALPAAHALARDADDNFPSGGDPCQGGNNPDNFKLTATQGPPGSSFFLQGKPHDPKTVGPGSDVVLNWREKPEANFSAKVNQDGTFTAFLKVPADFAPGPHMLMYAEASPYSSCLEFNVTQAQPGAAPGPVIPGLSLVAAAVSLFVKLLSLV